MAVNGQPENKEEVLPIDPSKDFNAEKIRIKDC